MGCEDCVRWECDMFVMGVMVCMWEVCGLEVHVVCECVRGVVGSVCVCDVINDKEYMYIAIG